MFKKPFRLKKTYFLLLWFTYLYTSDSYQTQVPDRGYHLDVSQFDSSYTGSWLYVGVGFEDASQRHRVSGYRLTKDSPVQAFARFGFRAHTSLQFALDVCGEIALNNENSHNILTDLNYLYFFQTSYDEIPTAYIGLGGPINVKSLLKVLYRINFKDICFSNFIIGKRIDQKKFIQIKIQDFRHLGFKKENYYLPSIEKLGKNTILELGFGF